MLIFDDFFSVVEWGGYLSFLSPTCESKGELFGSVIHVLYKAVTIAALLRFIWCMKLMELCFSPALNYLSLCSLIFSYGKDNTT